MFAHISIAYQPYATSHPQVWLTLNNLVVDPKCRAKYGFDEWRRDRLLTLKRFMNELLFDQMPVRASSFAWFWLRAAIIIVPIDWFARL